MERLRRTQAIAGLSNGLEIATWLVHEKLRGQSTQLHKLVEELPSAFGSGERRIKCEAASRAIDDLRDQAPSDLRGLLSIEGRAAQLYWGSLEGQPSRGLASRLRVSQITGCRSSRARLGAMDWRATRAIRSAPL